MDNDEIIAAVEVLEELEEERIPRPRNYWRCENAFNLSPEMFRKCFRLNREVARYIIQMIRPYMQEGTRQSALTIERKTLCALRFFASGGYQEVTGTNLFTAMSQASTSRSIEEVCNALSNPLIFNQWVQFPQTVEELRQLRNEFYNKFQFPDVVGCIDCTHIAIVSPPKDDPIHPEHVHVNRKNYHSINTQLICDHQLRILNVNARFPGSTHDARIWQESAVSNVMEQVYRHNPNDALFLIGDSGYPLTPWLLTPIRDPQQGSPEERFNNRFLHTRSIIERCNGVLKNRWRCLLKHRVLHYSPTKARRIINSCIVLHNMCIHFNIPEVEEENNVNVDYGLYNIVPQVEERSRINPDLTAARPLQQLIANRHFQ